MPGDWDWIVIGGVLLVAAGLAWGVGVWVALVWLGASLIAVGMIGAMTRR